MLSHLPRWVGVVLQAVTVYCWGCMNPESQATSGSGSEQRLLNLPALSVNSFSMELSSLKGMPSDPFVAISSGDSVVLLGSAVTQSNPQPPRESHSFDQINFEDIKIGKKIGDGSFGVSLPGSFH